MKEPNSTFTRNVAIAIGSLLVIAGVGWTAANTLNQKADAAELSDVQKEVITIRLEMVSRDDFKRLEDKVDALLLRNGLKPDTIK